MKFLLKHFQSTRTAKQANQINPGDSFQSKKIALLGLLTAVQTMGASIAIAAPVQLTLDQTFVGKYGYKVTGATRRTQSNTVNACSVLSPTTSNTASLSLPTGVTVVKAFLYWTGSTNLQANSDWNVTFEGQSISAPVNRRYYLNYASDTTEGYFNGRVDVTSIVQNKGSGTYSFSDLTVNTGTPHCSVKTVLAGWELIVIYQDNSLPNTAVNLYDGFVDGQNTSFNFTLDKLAVTNNPIASMTTTIWEGDSDLSNNEALRYDGGLGISTLANGPFDSNSTALGSNNTYGFDADTYNVSTLTQAGVTQLTGTVQTGQDYVFLNNVIIAATTQVADLKLEKTVDNATSSVGQTITFTVNVTNEGPDTTNNVTVKDLLPTEISHISNTGGGSYNPTTGIWNVGTLTNGQTKSLQITAQVNNTGNITNIAEVTGSSLRDPDSQINNNISTEDDQASVTVTATNTTSISGTLYQDTNNNDTFNLGETTLPANITVKLLDSTSTTLIQTTTTNASGQYTFTGVANGNYKIQVDSSDTDIPTGFILGTPNNLAITVSGSPITNQNFGFDSTVTDFGEAPNSVPANTTTNSYKTTLAEDGARHTIVNGVYLGNSVTADADGQPVTFGNAITTSDNDGVTFNPSLGIANLLQGDTAVDQTNTITVKASTGGYLNAWIDFNQDGSFGAGEQIVSDRAVSGGDNTLTFTVPKTVIAGATYARFRFTSQTGQANSAIGLAPNGEVEDYRLLVHKRALPTACSANPTEVFTALNLRWFERIDQRNHKILRAGTLPDGTLLDVIVTASQNTNFDRADLNAQPPATGSVNLRPPAASSTDFQFKFYQSGTTTPISGNYVMQFADIDGMGTTLGSPAAATNAGAERIAWKNSQVSAYEVHNPTWIEQIASPPAGYDVQFGGIYNNNVTGGDDTSKAIRLFLKNQSTLDVQYYSGSFAAIAADPKGVSQIVPACTSFSISGTLYQDSDGGDDLDATEPTLPANITLKLLDSTGTTVIQTTTTNASGQYTFTGITNGNYKIQVDSTDTDIPTGFTLGTPNNLAITVSGSSVTGQNFGFDVAAGFCNLGGGTNDPTIQPFISTEVGNTSVSGSIPTNLRSLTDQLDDTWRTAAGGSTTGTVEPWFGANSAPGSTTNFTYREPNSNTAITTTVESVQVPFTTPTTCNGGNATASGFALAFNNSLQDSSPRPSSLYNSADQPGFWNHTGGNSDSRRNAVRFTFAQPVKSFGAWFGDLETRTQGGGAPAYLRLLDASGNRIGQDIAITPQTLDNGTSSTPNPQPLNQANCSTSATSQLGCGNQTSRWVGFIDNNASPRIKQVLVIVGDDDDTGNGDAERLSFIGSNTIPIASNPNLLLVKRITAINGVPFNQFVDDPNTTNDNNSKWPTPANTYLRGVIDGGVVQPGDELEYTIYFLSNGDGNATNVSICDLVPENTTFIPTAFNRSTPTDGSLPGADLGIGLALNSTSLPTTPTLYLSNVADADRGEFFAAGQEPPVACSGTNSNGAVVITVVTKPNTLPRATASGTPTNSYGFIRFRARVK
ncbi:MAG TPA: hypothetical protein DCL61_30050 [Cyanobacteria bacterium UBA12227]|nr:hypothetical protein [Cyanobacteria bacterium UBA12227]HAX90244.1 hypothetical protein [Cyanobacteria bacterium UBA11370]HBY79537.1 hypothetical protein [Cyanobacteria bacterium UBA11148]